MRRKGSRPRRPKIVERGERRYVLHAGCRYEIRAIKGTKEAADLLNYAAVAELLRIPLANVEERQRKFGWAAKQGAKLPIHWREVLDALGRRKRMRFLRREDVVSAAAGPGREDSREQFTVKGRLRMSMSAAVRRLGWTRGRKCQALCKRHGLTFKDAVSPFTRRRLQMCDVADVERVESELAALKRPPSLHERPTMWLRDLVREVTAIRRGPEANSVASQGLWWIQTGCRWLDGAKLEADQAEDGSWYVDRGQAERIIEAVRGAMNGHPPQSRKTLNQSEVLRNYGYTWQILRRLEKDGKLHPARRPSTPGADGLRQILYLRHELDAIRDEELAFAPPSGFESIPDTRARRLGLSPPRLLAALKAGRDAGAIGFVRHPITDAYYHQVEEAKKWLTRVRPERPTKTGWKEEGSQNAEMLKWREDEKLDIAKIRDRAKKQFPDRHVPDGRAGKNFVKNALKSAATRRAKVAERPC